MALQRTLTRFAGLACALFLTAAFTDQPEGSADGPGKIMIVMDSSGSMWGQIDGETKRDIARRALRQTVSQLPKSSEMGLIAYGHRRKGDCGDIELMQQPKIQNGESIADTVDTLKPVGKTPLTQAVRQAADVLKIAENRATVIVITDGIETCNADPCAAGAELEATGIDFTAHVVGFGLSEMEGRQVACLAEETGGQYFEAANAGELSEALDQVAAAVEELVEEPIEETATAIVTAPAKAEIGSTFTVEWEGPDAPQDYVDLVPPGYERTSGELSYAYTRNGDRSALRAPKEPGRYQIRYVWHSQAGKRVIADTTIEITEAEVAIFAPERVGIGEYFAVEWRGPNNQADYIDIVPAGYTDTTGELAYRYTKRGNPLEIQAPDKAGPHELRYVAMAGDGRRALKSAPLEIEEVRAELAFDPQISLGKRVEVYWTGPGTKNDYVDIVPRGYTDTSGELGYAYTKVGNPLALNLPSEPGAYDMRYVLQGPQKRRVLYVSPLTLKDVVASLVLQKEGAGGTTIEVEWAGPGAPNDYIDVVPRGSTPTTGEKSYTYVKQGNPLNLRLPGKAGEYDVRYVLQAADGRKVKAVQPITVNAAQASVTFDSPAEAGGRLSVTWTGPNLPSDYIDIVARGTTATTGELSYATTKQGSPASLKMPADPGSYDVRYILSAVDGRLVIARKPLEVE